MRLGPPAPLDAVKATIGESRVNMRGICSGGTLLAITLAYLKATGEDSVNSASFMVSLQDFAEVGDLAVFVDQGQLFLLDQQMAQRGYLQETQMSTAFSLLRANDLMWNHVVNNYLLGKQPPAFDLLYWNSDSTRMPYRMHSYYLRNMYLETSRRGGHLWLFFAEAVPGRLAREFGQGLMAAHNAEDVELFPKQDRVTNGPGSLIRMPFGVHRLTGQRYGFITPDGECLAPTLREQIYALRAPETVPEAAFDAYRSFVSSEEAEASKTQLDAVSDILSEKIKASVTALEFIGRYIDLKPTGSGALGLCPFHDDNHPSFGVNTEGDFWHCFAGCGGGSVIDWWIKWRECDFTTAVRELAEMLLCRSGVHCCSVRSCL